MTMTVKTISGEVRGKVEGKIAVFKGIPYAAPPFEENRFLPPQPVERWEGVREVLNYGPTAPKPTYSPPYNTLLPEPIYAGEDCLNLNVWTPAPLQSKLPVMVWIHGGAFRIGSGAVPTYDGSKFARDGVVCVTFNYRLGIEGFLNLGGQTANLGLLDQIAALQWVRANIAAFGGDPTRVTVFGESAGAMSIGALLSMPTASGLFSQAILESGAGHHAIPPTTSQRMAEYIADELGCAATPAAFAAQPLEKLITALENLSRAVADNPNPFLYNEVALLWLPFLPQIDGAILPTLPINGIRDGAGTGVKVLIGTNTTDYAYFIEPTGAISTMNWITFAGLATLYGLFGGPFSPVRELYTGLYPDASPGEQVEHMVTDWYFRQPAIMLAEARVNHGEVAYMYEFAWPSPRFSMGLGACHVVEIPFVFDHLDLETSKWLVGDKAPQELATAMHAAWVAFAKNGDPGWPAYDLNRRATMRFNTTSQVVDDPHTQRRQFWASRR